MSIYKGKISMSGGTLLAFTGKQDKDNELIIARSHYLNLKIGIKWIIP